MSEAAASGRGPFLLLPGFSPDALGFALRTALALLLAYWVAFWAQLDTASSAGLCVAIVAQASPGMAMSKALYRIAGTVLGGVVGVAMVAAFPQDRTALLVAFTLWLGLCTFVAALLRDFRSYGAVLCGYTVGIIAVSGIDAPQGALVAMLNRVAAILLGVAAVALVNSALMARNTAYQTLQDGLRAARAAVDGLARQAKAGGMVIGEATTTQGAALLALTSQAAYAVTELPDGPRRVSGARAAIAALLAMLSAVRAVAVAGPEPEPQGTPRAAFVQEREAELVRQAALAEAGMATLATGHPRQAAVHLRVHYDVGGAALSALRTIIAVGLGAVFCVVAGWPGVTGLLVQQAAFTALLGMQPDPSRAGVAMGLSLPLPAVAAGLVGFVLLPQVSGFVPFALVVGPCAFVFALAAHHPATARFGPGMLLYFALLLAPANLQSYDLAGYVNAVLIQMVAVLFMVLAFRLILPVSGRRRLGRIAGAIVDDLRHTLRHGRALDAAACQSLKYDRLAQAQVWLGRPTPARLAVFARLHAFAELDTALRRAWSGLAAVRQAGPGLAAPLAAAEAALLQHDPARLDEAAQALLSASGGLDAAQRAVSGMYGAQLLLARQARALRHYHLVAG